MKIYILRHGIALDRNDPSILSDASRPLIPIGIEKTNKIAKFLKKQKFNFDRILSSPYLRAKETAIIVSDLFRLEIQETEDLTPDGSFDKLIDEINSNNVDEILLVGHEPHLSFFISYLLIGDESLDLTLKKGGFCSIEFIDKVQAGMGNLICLLTPKQMIK